MVYQYILMFCAVFLISQAPLQAQDSNKGLNWMRKKEFDLPVYFPGQKYPQQYLTDVFPVSFILDKEGKLVHTQLGMADYGKPGFIKQIKTWINQ